MESCSCGFDESRIGSPAYFADQYAVWDELRETCGVHASQLFNGWVLTRYREVDSCLRDTDNFSNAAATARKIERYPEELRERARPLLAYLDSRSVLFQDPPEHTKQRRILARAFVPHHIANLEGTVREMTRALLEPHLANGHMEFLQDVARPLPGMVLAHFLGVPDADREQFVKWGRAAVGISMAVKPTEQIVDDALDAYKGMSEYIEALLDERRAQPPRDDFIGLVMAAEGGNALTHEEVVASCIMQLYAGHETSTVMLSTGLLALLQHPDQRTLLADRPELIPDAVEEMLRWKGPVVMIPARGALHDIVIGGKQIPAGAGVFNAIGVANRDPRSFPDAHVFDITRKARQLEFGAGAHLCLGAPVARLEARVMLEEMLSAMPRLRLADEPVAFLELVSLCAPAALHIEW